MKLSFEGVEVKLGGRDILTGTTLESHEGKMVGIIGANGCGKSTLIKTTFGIVHNHGGKVMLDGKTVRSYKPKELAARIGYVGQDQSVAFDFSVRDVVGMGLFARKDVRNGKALINEALESLGIERFADRSIQKLSGGERKMVFIARALVQGTDMFILDEPTNHLDIHHQLFVMDYLKNSGKTTLIVIHDLRLAAHYCDYLYMLSDGRVYAEGAPIDVLTSENVEHVFRIGGYAGKTKKGVLDFYIFDEESEGDIHRHTI